MRTRIFTFLFYLDIIRRATLKYLYTDVVRIYRSACFPQTQELCIFITHTLTARCNNIMIAIIERPNSIPLTS